MPVRGQVQLAMNDLHQFLVNTPNSSGMSWLEKQWKSIPEGIDGECSYRLYDREGEVETQIPVSMIVGSSHNAKWGDLDYRRNNYERILKGAYDEYIQGTDYSDWFYKLLVHDKMYLTMNVNSKHGILYRIGQNGNHRLHVLKAMNITAPVTVTIPIMKTTKTMIFDFSTYHERLKILLVSLGYISELGGIDYKIEKLFPSWLVRSSWERLSLNDTITEVVKTSIRYKEYYPNFGNDVLESLLLDEERFYNALTNKQTTKKTGLFGWFK